MTSTLYRIGRTAQNLITSTRSLTMSPIIHCVRHAQGIHNLTPDNWGVIDPPLTTKGEEQCRQLRDVFPHHEQVDLIVASPLIRTVYTALHAFEPVLKARAECKVLLLPDLQEISGFACDIGSPLSTLQAEVAEKKLPVDLSLVGENWEKKTGRHEPKLEALSIRARDVRCWLKARHEKHIALVSHGAFLHFLTEDWEECATGWGTGWSNTECRSYVFKDDVYDDLSGVDFGGRNATLAETEESRVWRQKLASPPSRDEQKALFKLGMDDWKGQGLYFSEAHRESERKAAEVEVAERDVQSV